MIYNSLDKMSIETVMKYVSQGAELIINDGHVQGMVFEDTNKAAAEEDLG